MNKFLIFYYIELFLLFINEERGIEYKERNWKKSEREYPNSGTS